jgi:hypothetical protein
MLKLIFKPSSFEVLIQYLHVFLQCNFFCACVLEEVITEDTQRHAEAVLTVVNCFRSQFKMIS